MITRTLVRSVLAGSLIHGAMASAQSSKPLPASGATSPAAQMPTTPPSPDTFRRVASGLHWRNIGPDRGGRSLAAAGSRARPFEYYFGATGGGLWKTVDGGTSWKPVTDGQLASSSVGAVAIAESSPDVVYIGMGESQLRSNILQGDGVYRSSDAGRTWQHLGLPKSQAISRIRVDPTNPDVVYVAALGSPWGATPERGIYRSRDGGASWMRVLYRNDSTGGSDLTIDPHNPNVLFASLWNVRMAPGGAITNGRTGSGLFKSVDGGDTWTEITRNPGLPAGVVGNIGVAISGADANRVYALVDAVDGGLFLSDDAGGRWVRVNDDGSLRQRPTYFNRLTADPANRDVVYVLNLLLYKSTDGGRTIGTISPPHVDHHDLWIAPDDPRRMIDANDGGASVSINGGATWTRQDLPTAQLYHVATTRDLPYHVCGAQQDANTICVPSSRSASRSINPIVGQEEFLEPVYAAGGGESGSIAPDPADPDILFASGPQALISRLDRRLGLSQARDHQVLPSWDSSVERERFQWTIPLVFSPREPGVLFAASQHLWRTRDGGRRWQRISPDLSRPRSVGERDGSIWAVAPSRHEAGTIWAGTDDGLVHLTRDGGASWRNVTPPGLRDSSKVSGIEASPHRPGTAYVAVKRYEVNDRAPYLFRTDDYGATWTAIVHGLADGDIVQAVREDPARAGLLYAATEHGVRISFDDGREWLSLSLDLPDTQVSDLIVERQELVISTHGRSFWVLAGLAPIRQLHRETGASPLTLFAPASVRRRLDEGTIHYLLADSARAVAIDILDSTGAVIRQLPATDGRRSPRPSGRRGLNQFTWDLRHEGATVFPGMIMWVGQPVGPLATPGRYQVRVTADGVVATQAFTVTADPRATGVSAAQLREQFALASKIRDRVSATNSAVMRIRTVRAQVEERIARAPAIAVTTSATALLHELGDIEGELYQVKLRGELDATIYPIRINNRLTNLQMSVETGDGAPTAQAYEAFNRLSGALSLLERRLAAALGEPLQQLNRLIVAEKLEPVR